MSVRMAFDLLEDILAFLYSTDGREKTSPTDDDSTCPVCGCELDDTGDGGKHCPGCGDEHRSN